MQAAEQILNWHEEGKQIALNYKRCEARLIEILVKMAESKGYSQFQCDSLRSYAIWAWNLSENVVSDLVTVAKKSVEVPELIEALKRGKVTVSKLRKICPVITEKNQQEWIELAEECSTRVIEQTVAMAKPREVSSARMAYVGEHRVLLSTEISEELMLKLECVSDQNPRTRFVTGRMMAGVRQKLKPFTPFACATKIGVRI